jgi:hypothetical protein
LLRMKTRTLVVVIRLDWYRIKDTIDVIAVGVLKLDKKHGRSNVHAFIRRERCQERKPKRNG